MIHGSSSDYRTWENQMNVLSNDCQVIAYSRRYHYPNKKIERGNDYSMKEHVEGLKALINYFGNTPVNIIGHSYGALSPKVFSNLEDRIEELISGVKRVTISNSSHIMHEDIYTEYNSKITSFL